MNIRTVISFENMKAVKLNKKKMLPSLLLFLVLLGTFTFVSISTVDAGSNKPTLEIRLSKRRVPMGEVADMWFYVKNSIKEMERTGNTILNCFELTSFDMNLIIPNGTLEEYPDLHLAPVLSERWNPTVKPGETVLVFYIGLLHAPPEDCGILTVTVTLDGVYEGSSIVLEKTYRLVLMD